MPIKGSLILILAAGRLLACTCIEVPQKTALHSAVAVFQGKATKVEHMDMVEAFDPVSGKVEKRPPKVDDYTVVTFRVSKAWKGPVTSTMKVQATARPSMCSGFEFREGKEYIVYATDDINQDWDKLRPFAERLHVYGIGNCPLRIRADADRESRLLGRSRAPAR